MCNLYSETKGQQAILAFTRATRDRSGNLPPLPAIFPDSLAPVVHVAADGVRELTMMRWGFPPPPAAGSRPVTNVRNLASPYWRTWLKPEFRCLIPASAFCEWTDGPPKVTNWFALSPERPPFAFAGLWRPWRGTRRGEDGEHRLYALLTCAANDDVRPVHAKAMPVILTTPDACDAWLTSPAEEAAAMQQPLPAGALTIVARGARQDPPGVEV